MGIVIGRGEQLRRAERRSIDVALTTVTVNFHLQLLARIDRQSSAQEFRHL